MRFVKNLKEELISNLRKVKRKIIVITGFVTTEGFDFFESYIDGDKVIDKTIVFKLHLMDFKNGASSFNFKKAIENGWKVYVNKTIHAKNYIFDDKILIQGSSNLTSNGIGLNHTRKDDNNIICDYNNNDFINWVANKINSSVLISSDNVDNLENNLRKAMLESCPQKFLDYQKWFDKRLIKRKFHYLPPKHLSKEDEPILKRLVQNFVKAFKNSPDSFSSCLNQADLDKYYMFCDNIAWYSSYVIDISSFKLNLEQFHCDNQLYKYTPRIYKYEDKFYVERMFGSTLNFDYKDNIVHILSTLKEMFRVGIVAYNFKEIFIWRNSVRFGKFFPIKYNDHGVVESFYKNELIKLCEDEEIKTLIQDFQLKDGQHGVN